MRIETLRYFQKIADTGSIRHSAEELYITQQGLSQAMQQLEAELGTELLYRHGNRLRLTAAGGVLLDYAGRMCKLNDELREALGHVSVDSSAAGTERLTIYVTPIVSHTFLSRILTIFQKRFSGYPLSIIEMDAEAMLDGLELDCNSLGILQAPDFLVQSSRLLAEGRAVMDDFFVSPLLISSAASGSPVAGKSLVTLDEFAQLPLALYGLEWVMARRFLAGRGSPQVVFNSANLLLCRERIARGGMVGFSNSIVEKYVRGPRLTTVPFELRVDMHSGYLYAPSVQLTPILRDLICIMRAEFDE